MDSDTEYNERRRHKRFSCKNFAVTANFKACSILNISLGGFAFYYDNSTDWPHETIDSGILFGDFIYLEDIPFHTVADIVYPYSKSTIITGRQRGVQFGKLSSYQRKSLEQYISHLIKKAA